MERKYLEFKGPRVVFYRPATLEQLLHLKDLHPTAKIIAGNTEVGESEMVLLLFGELYLTVGVILTVA